MTFSPNGKYLAVTSGYKTGLNSIVILKKDNLNNWDVTTTELNGANMHSVDV
jgi:hypothetical protein